MTPRLISSEVGDIVPLVIRRPGEVHGIDLRAATKSSAPRIENSQPVITSALAYINQTLYSDLSLTAAHLPEVQGPRSTSRCFSHMRILDRDELESHLRNVQRRSSRNGEGSRRQRSSFVNYQHLLVNDP
jgi:hypothetical protein